jgi:hypothetical protein
VGARPIAPARGPGWCVMTAVHDADRLPDLVGCPPVHVARHSERSSHTTLRIGERLWNLGDPHLATMGDRLILCASNAIGWRCQISTVCPRCGRRAAIRERIATEREYATTAYDRALVTRTVLAPSIATGHRVLLAARRAQTRSSDWRVSFWCGRGRIEAVPCDDGRWLVHAHEQCFLRVHAVSSDASARRLDQACGRRRLRGHPRLPDDRSERRTQRRDVSIRSASTRPSVGGPSCSPSATRLFGSGRSWYRGCDGH